MATYKVIQDIEAEDKLVGPLTLRQFLYAAITVILLYLCYFSLSKHIPFMLIIFLPFALLGGFFAFPWARDQPTEVWALAKVRFMFKPHRRIWDQSGIKQLVSVNVPKKPTITYTNNLSQDEVQNRLKALAETIDTRGWVTKNVNVNIYEPVGAPGVLPGVTPQSDRLVTSSSLPQPVPDVDIRADEDVFDEKNNPTAQHFDEMITQREQEHHQKLVNQIQSQTPTNPSLNTAQTPGPQTQNGGQTPSQGPQPDYWFLNETEQPKKNSTGYTTFGSKVIIPGTADYYASQVNATPTPEEQAVAERAKENAAGPEPAYTHLRRVEPLADEADIITDNPNTTRKSRASKKHDSLEATSFSVNSTMTTSDDISQPATDNTTQTNGIGGTATPMTPPVDPAILNLASDNNRNVASIAQEANRVQQLDASNGGEVIITLH